MATKKNTEAAKTETGAEKGTPPNKICGIIMPISACEYKGTQYEARHWQHTRRFLEDAILEAGFEPRAVWEDQSQSIIQGRIVNNIADFDLAICVICGMNHNVLIELGLRLMTNKPVLVIHDDNNLPLPFDVNSLESFQMPTPSCAGYGDYQDLKEQIKDTLRKMAKDGYKPFLSYFRPITPKAVEKIHATDLAEFMNETRNALRELQNKVGTQPHMEVQKATSIQQHLPVTQWREEYEQASYRLEELKNNPNSTKEQYDELRDQVSLLRQQINDAGGKRIHPALYGCISWLLFHIRHARYDRFPPASSDN